MMDQTFLKIIIIIIRIKQTLINIENVLQFEKKIL